MATGSGAMHSRVPAKGSAVSPGDRVAWPVRTGVVPPLADGYVSRPETAAGLRTALVPGATVVLVPDRAAAGGAPAWLGSCGKTQLAVSAAQAMWQSGTLDLLAWVTATSRASVLTGYVEAAVAAMGITPDDDAESVAARFVRWLADTDRSWLVVLDGLSAAADLDGLWPQARGGRVLITAADPAALAGAHQAQILPVGIFSPREALGFLMGRLAADPDQRLGAIDLTEDLGCEPMALAQAGAVIASSAQTCRDYRDRFAHRREQLAETGAADPSAAAITWTLSVDQAERLSPGGSIELLLAIGALLDGHEIPGAVFTTSATCRYLAEDGAAEPADPERAWDGVLSLERAGLLTIDAAGRSHPVRMSPVVQAVVRAAIPRQMLDRVAAVAADALLEIWPEDEPEPWLLGGLRSCTASLQQAAGGPLWPGGCHPLLLRAGRSLDGARLTGPAVAYWTQLVTASDRILGAADPDTLVAGQQLAEAYVAAGRAAEAVSTFQWALAGRARAGGPDHPGIIAIQISLGHALVAAGQPGDAVAVLAEAVAACERVRGPDHPDTLGARDEYAAACSAAGRFGDAIPVYRRTLEDRERIQGPQHPETITTRQKLADAYLAEGQMKAAISQHKRAVADRERVAGATIRTPSTPAAASRPPTSQPAGWPPHCSFSSRPGRTPSGCWESTTPARWRGGPVS